MQKSDASALFITIKRLLHSSQHCGDATYIQLFCSWIAKEKKSEHFASLLKVLFNLPKLNECNFSRLVQCFPEEALGKARSTAVLPGHQEVAVQPYPSSQTSTDVCNKYTACPMREWNLKGCTGFLFFFSHDIDLSLLSVLIYIFWEPYSVLSPKPGWWLCLHPRDNHRPLITQSKGARNCENNRPYQTTFLPIP